MRQIRGVRIVLLLIVAGVAWSAQAAAQEMPPMPTPGPEHQVLKMDEGVWDAVVEISPPGAPAMTSKGVETNVMGCGGLCLVPHDLVDQKLIRKESAQVDRRVEVVNQLRAD